MKKFFALSILLLALSALGFFYFKNEKSHSQVIPLHSAIPNQFPLAIESGNWTELLHKIDTFSYGEILNKQDWYVGSKSNLMFLEKVKEQLEPNQQYLLSSQALLAYGNAGNSKLGILLALPLEGGSSKQLKNILEEANLYNSSYDFEDQEVFTLKDFNGVGEAACSFKNGILLFSYQSSFVEEAILAIQQNLHQDWEALHESINLNKDAIVYVQPTELNYLASYLFKKEGYDIMSYLEQITGRMTYQLNFFPTELIFNGFALRSTNSLLDTLRYSYPAENYIENLLPSNTAFFQTISSGNSKVLQTSNFEFKSIYAAVDESFATFTLESFNTNLENRKGVLIALNEEDILNRLQSLDPDIIEFKTIKETTIYKSNLGSFLNKAFFIENYLRDSVYLSKMDKVLVLSSNWNVVEQYINSYKANSLLKTNTTYTDFKSSLATKSNLDIYGDFNLVQPYLGAITTENTWQNTIGKFNFQFTNSGEKIYSIGKLNFQEQQTQESKLLWETKLDTLSSFKPQIVKNHLSNELELMVQDLSNNLYLLTTSGEVIWKIGISAPIMGDVYQIDYYKNKKYQYVFNTNSKIYIVDRNGNNVDGFPIDLPSKATNGLLVINYDNAGTYRYMVACDNGNVYGYEQNGSPLSGWSPKKEVGVVKHPLKHISSDGKDYIFFNNSEGIFYALNRKGENRFTPVSSSNFSNVFTFVEKKFIGGDKGILNEIDLGGTLKSKEILASNYTVFATDYSILQSSQAYAFASGSNFKFQQSQWKNFASYEVEGNIRKIESFVNNNNLWFLLYTSNQVYLVDELGTLHPDFPLNTKVDIRILNLIAGKDRVVVYNDLNGNLKVLEIKWSN